MHSNKANFSGMAKRKMRWKEEMEQGNCGGSVPLMGEMFL